MNFKTTSIMKLITKVFIVACVCGVCLSCGKDDDDSDSDYVCTECSAGSDGTWSTPAQFCGPKSEVALFEKRYKENAKQPGVSVRCVRKK